MHGNQDDDSVSPEILRRLKEKEVGSKTLRYHLLGQSLTKAGQDQVDQNKVSEIIYNASKGSKFFNREEARDQILTQKIEQILTKKAHLDNEDLTHQLRIADRAVAEMELTRDLTQHIVHMDCDAFYAAVEQLERPELKHLPFAVGGGVLTTCNYVARKFGCRSGMAGFVALKLCPSLILIRPNFQKYTAKAEEIREVLAKYDSRFESASIDEAYLNITEYCREFRICPADAVEQMRQEISEKTDITVSAGIAANTKLAKICSNMNKPNGQYILPNDRATIIRFMKGLPTRKVNGIGRVLERELMEIGVTTCGDIYEQRKYLRLLFGEKTFQFLISCYLGLGRTRVQPSEEYERKSIGTESTFRELSDSVKLREKLRWTAEELEKEMARAECKGRTVCLKIKLHTFEVLTRQVATPRPVSSADDLYHFSLPMLIRLEQDTPSLKVRLMGLRCTHLESTKKPDALAFFGHGKLRTSVAESSIQEPPNRESLESQRELIENGNHSTSSTTGSSLDEASAPESRYQTPGKSMLGKHSRNSQPEPNNTTLPLEQWWDCPICLRPQEANERAFNHHVDLCLSRQTIRDVLQSHQAETEQKCLSDPKRQRLKDSKSAKDARVGPRQTKLSFI